MLIDPASIVELETTANAAMPALKAYWHDGWLLRFSEGYTKRANSIHPLFPSTHDLATKIAFCEALYASCGLPLIFKITATSQPPHLDESLADQGYQIVSPTLLQTCVLTPSHDAPYMEGTPTLTKAWLKAYQTLDPVPARHHDALEKTLRQIPFPTWYASLMGGDGAIIAVGLAVLQPPRLGLFNIVVDESQRGQGLGRQIMTRLLAWGRKEGAQYAYLQVSADNHAAIHLYASLNFKTQYQYWYRIK